MLYSWALSGMFLGLLSSFHCVGMCGAIAFALPVYHLTPAKKTTAILLYNLGRISTYTALGAFFGLLGRRFYIAGLQQGLSVLLGLLLLMAVLSGRLWKSATLPQPIQQLYSGIQNFIAAQLNHQKLSAFWLVGAANGLLPCGMVYVAVTGAMAAADLQNSVLFMLFFGLGTLPLMALLTGFGMVAGATARQFFRKSTPYFMAIMGVILILRGMNLGIPYVSPHLQNTAASAIRCH